MSNFLSGYWIIWILFAANMVGSIWQESWITIPWIIALAIIWTLERRVSRDWRKLAYEFSGYTEAQVQANISNRKYK